MGVVALCRGGEGRGSVPEAGRRGRWGRGHAIGAGFPCGAGLIPGRGGARRRGSLGRMRGGHLGGGVARALLPAACSSSSSAPASRCPGERPTEAAQQQQPRRPARSPKREELSVTLARPALPCPSGDVARPGEASLLAHAGTPSWARPGLGLWHLFRRPGQAPFVPGGRPPPHPLSLAGLFRREGLQVEFLQETAGAL